MLKKLSVGLVGTYQKNFIVSLALKGLEESIQAMGKLAKENEFNFYPVRKALITKKDAEKARRELEDKGVDFLLIQNSSFSAGEIILPLAQMNAHLGLWAVPEPTQEGPLPLNSFCGMNMYGSIITQYLKDYDIPFKWFFGRPEDQLFLDRFKLTLRVLTALKSLAYSRISLVGGVAPGFHDLYFDERKLQSRYGISIFRNELSEVLDKAKQYGRKKVGKLAEKIKNEGVSRNVDAKEFDKAARVYLALEEIARGNGYDAMAINCWPKFVDEYQFAPCSVIGRLNQNGIVAACEGDIPAGLSMLLLNYLNQDTSALMDLSKFDVQDDSILLWHCGVAAPCWANKEGVEYRVHTIQKVACVNNMILKAQPAIIMRTTDDGKKMFLATADIIDRKKKSYEGSRGWLDNIQIRGRKVSALDFINTVMVEGVPHHFPIATGDLTDELMEVGAWLGIEPLKVVRYKEYMQRPGW